MITTVDKLYKLATITVTATEDDTPIEGNVLDSDDPVETHMAEVMTAGALAAGNTWAWCIASVTVSYQGHTAGDSVGACSFEDERDFRRSGYYEDMVDGALREIVARLITDEEIRAFAAEAAAAAAGHAAQVYVCRVALGFEQADQGPYEQDRARVLCAEAIDATRTRV